MTKWDSSLGRKCGSTFANRSVWQNILIREKNHVILSTGAEKAFDKTRHPFLIKSLRSVGIEGTCLNLIKTVYEKPTANIILNGGEAGSLSSFSLKIRNATRMPTLPIVIQHSTRSPCNSSQTRKRDKRYPDRQRRSQTVSLCRWHDTLDWKPKRLHPQTTISYRAIQ